MNWYASAPTAAPITGATMYSQRACMSPETNAGRARTGQIHRRTGDRAAEARGASDGGADRLSLLPSPYAGRSRLARRRTKPRCAGAHSTICRAPSVELLRSYAVQLCEGSLLVESVGC